MRSDQSSSACDEAEQRSRERPTPGRRGLVLGALGALGGGAIALSATNGTAEAATTGGPLNDTGSFQTGTGCAAGDRSALPDGTVGVRAGGTPTTTRSSFDATESSYWIRTGDLAPLLPSGDTTGASDAAAINAAVTARAVAGGVVALGSGVFYVNAPVILRTGVIIRGAGRLATTVMLAKGANVDVFQGANFSSLTGSGANTQGAGPGQWALADLLVDGNRANQSSAGYGVRVFGYDFDIARVTIRNCYLDGMYTEWGSFGGTTDGMEARVTDFRAHDNGGWGWHDRGPHDSMISNSIFFLNNRSGGTAGGLWTEDDTSGNNKYLAGALVMSNVHIWGYTHAWGAVIDASTFATNCESEGAVYGELLVRAPLIWTGGKVFDIGATSAASAIQLGDDGKTPGAPTTKSYVAGHFDIRTKIEGFWGSSRATAPIAWVNANTGNLDVNILVRSAGASTAIAGSSVGSAASASTLNVASTSTFPSGGTLTVPTSTGTATLTYTGVTATSFTGCTVAAGSGSGTVSSGNVTLVIASTWGNVDPNSRVVVNATHPGATRAQLAAWSSESRLGPISRDVGASYQAFNLTSNYNALVNLNATGAATGNRLEHVNGLLDRWFSDSYATPTVEVDGATGHLSFPGPKKPLVYPVSAAGSGASASIVGNDRRGNLVLTTGSSSGLGPFPATVANLFFAAAYANGLPFVTLTPQDGPSAQLGAYARAWSTGAFLLGFANPPAPSTTYLFGYSVDG